MDKNNNQEIKQLTENSPRGDFQFLEEIWAKDLGSNKNQTLNTTELENNNTTPKSKGAFQFLENLATDPNTMCKIL
jgi:hypothetical protein